MHFYLFLASLLFSSNFNFILFEDLMEGYKAVELNSEENSKGDRSLWGHCQAISDMKFTYVVSCQQYGIQKQSGDARAQDILKLMTKYVRDYVHKTSLKNCI